MDFSFAVPVLETVQRAQLDQPVNVGFVHSGPIGQLLEG